MGRMVAFLYGTVAYLIFLATFIYAIGFVGNLFVPQSIDTGGVAGSFGTALFINVLLLGLFATQHSVMARPGFKEKWTKIVPEPVERSTYVLLSSLALALLFWQWRPITTEVWNLQETAAAPVLTGVFFAGWGLVLVSTFLLNHFDLFGLRQVYLHLTERERGRLTFRTPLFYRLVRHPLMLGFMIAFWAAPLMTVGHLLFAATTTVYMLMAIQWEEKDLVASLGDDYRQYQSEVPMIIPIPRVRPTRARDVEEEATAEPAVQAEVEPSVQREPEPAVGPSELAKTVGGSEAALDKGTTGADESRTSNGTEGGETGEDSGRHG